MTDQIVYFSRSCQKTKVGQMYRKTVLATLCLSILINFNSISVASQVKILNGMPCAKFGAKSSNSSEKYTCSKNVFTKSIKLIWLWDGCILDLKNYDLKLSEFNRLKNSQKNTKQVNIVAAESSLSYLKSVAQDACKFGL